MKWGKSKTLLNYPLDSYCLFQNFLSNSISSHKPRHFCEWQNNLGTFQRSKNAKLYFCSRLCATNLPTAMLHPFNWHFTFVSFIVFVFVFVFVIVFVFCICMCMCIRLKNIVGGGRELYILIDGKISKPEITLSLLCLLCLADAEPETKVYLSSDAVWFSFLRCNFFFDFTKTYSTQHWTPWTQQLIAAVSQLRHL